MKGFRFGSTQGAFYILPGQEVGSNLRQRNAR